MNFHAYGVILGSLLHVSRTAAFRNDMWQRLLSVSGNSKVYLGSTVWQVICMKYPNYMEILRDEQSYRHPGDCLGLAIHCHF